MDVGGRFFGVVCVCVLTTVGWGGLAPTDVAVVVNADSWASMTVANEFIRLRGVPGANVVYVSDVANLDTLSAEVFRDSVLRPVLATLERRGVRDQIAGVFYSTDLPYRVSLRSDFDAAEKGKLDPELLAMRTPQDAKRDGKQRIPTIFSATGSVNGLTFLYQDFLESDVSYLKLNASRYARRFGPLSSDTKWSADEQKQMLAVMAGMTGLKHYEDELRKQQKAAGDGEGAVDIASAVMARRREVYTQLLPIQSQLATAHPRAAHVQYNLACMLAVVGRQEDAVTGFERAVTAGWHDREHAGKDPDLVSVRETPRFNAALGKIRPLHFVTQPAAGFRADRAWGRDGSPGGGDSPRYLLSTMLAYSGGRGTSVRKALLGLRSGARADGTRPEGTVYFMKNKNIRSKTREWGFASAVELLGALGVKAEVLPGVVPSGKHDVRGVLVGAAGFDWAKSGSTIMPGAICEHLTSTGGVMAENGGQTPLSVFLRHGAVAASGAVVEPFAIQQKFPTPFMHAYYAQGCTVAEAFYLSVSCPYQLLIVGDPLCRPWAVVPDVALAGLDPDTAVATSRELRFTVQDTAKRPVAEYHVYIDGRRTGVTADGRYRLEPADLAAGHHELTVVAVLADPAETTGSVVVPFRVGDKADTTLEIDGDRTADWGGELTLSARAPGAKRILFRHNGRDVAAIGGSSGVTGIASTDLGIGTARIEPWLELRGKQLVRARPFDVTVTEPRALTPLPLKRPAEIQGGVQIRVADNPAVLIPKTSARDWMKQAGVTKDGPFSVSGYTTIEREDLHQIQIQTERPVKVYVNDREVIGTRGRTWRFYPVVLLPGTHSLRVDVGASRAQPALDIRFGGAGARKVGAPQFWVPGGAL